MSNSVCVLCCAVNVLCSSSLCIGKFESGKHETEMQSSDFSDFSEMSCLLA